MVIKHESCYYLGYISKAQGFKGGVIAFLDVDNPADYKNLKSLLVDINGVLTPFFVETLNLKDKGFVHMKFEGVDDGNSANRLTNKDMYLPLENLPELGDDEYYLHELVGMKVEDENMGELGVVEKVLDYSANPLIQLFRDSTEVLIPLNDAFIDKVDKKGKVIRVSLPEGMVDLNQN